MAADYRERLAEEASRVRASGKLGRSEPLIRLFDFLLERALAGHAPSEIEIAQEVFNKLSDYDVGLDASVRVYIHRLRRKLSEHYARAPDDAERISIPLGEYRMVLAALRADEAVPGKDQVAEPPPARPLGRIWITVIVLGLLNGLAWLLFVARSPGAPDAVRSKLWQTVSASARPTMVVVGDYYVFGGSDDGITVNRLIRDFSINSHDELDAHLLLHPDQVGRYLDLDLHYLPQSMGRALGSLLPTINAVSSGAGPRTPIEPMSEFKPEIIKDANIVYVGYFSGMGPLLEPVFRASGFRIGADFDELIDKASGRHFRSDWGVVADGKVPHRDYGYIASLQGPSGNRIIIIAGTRDPAVAQMAEIAADKQQLDAIDTKSGGGAFEAFYEVRTLGNLNVGSSLVVARPIRGGAIWQQ